MGNYWQAIRSFNGSVWRYLAMWGLIAFAYFGCVGVLQNLYLLRLGYDIESIGLLIAWGQLVWAMVAFPAASLGRRIGPKRAIMLSLGLTAVAFGFFYAVEVVPPAMRLPWLLAWQAAIWIASALFMVNAVPYLAGVTQPRQRGYAFAMQAAIVPFAGFFGSLIAGQLPDLFARLFGHTLDEPWPYRYGLLAVPLAYALTLIVFRRAQTVSLGDGAAHHQDQGRAPVATLLVFGLITICQSISDGTQQAFFNVYLDRGLGLPPSQIGAIIGIASLLPVLTALASAPLMARLGAGATFGLASAAMSAFLAMMALLPTVLAAALSRMGTGATGSVAGPSRNVFSQEIVAHRWRTTSSAVSMMGMALGWALAAAIGGALIRVIGFSGVFLVGGLFALAGAALMFGFLQLRRARAAAAPKGALAQD